MIFWKLIWQVLFIFGFTMFIGMFIVFSYRGYYELLELLRDTDDK
jgi:hypothetical protein